MGQLLVFEAGQVPSREAGDDATEVANYIAGLRSPGDLEAVYGSVHVEESATDPQLPFGLGEPQP